MPRARKPKSKAVSKKKPPPGYAFKAGSARPREPRLTLLSPKVADSCEHVGFHVIDDSQHWAFKVPGKREYWFTRFAA